MHKLKAAATWFDRVLFGTKAGKVVILAALVALGVPAMEAAPIAEVINVALDAASAGA